MKSVSADNDAISEQRRGATDGSEWPENDQTPSDSRDTLAQDYTNWN
jgi:hypothetical protein